LGYPVSPACRQNWPAAPGAAAGRAAEACQEAGDFATPGPIRANLKRWLAPSRTAVGSAAARGLLAEGRQMAMEHAVASALASSPEQAWRPGPRRTLTRREREVAVLAARGLTNRQIASQLVVSVRTVEVHVDHILTKLGFHTRTQLAVWALEHGLLPGNK
jgi:DNA-binding CsgD family transcriptional regulator